MLLKRFALLAAFLLLGLLFAAVGQAKPYNITAGGGQLHIGNGLPLPIQFPPALPTGSVFPPLKIPPKATAHLGQPTGGPFPPPMKIGPYQLSKPAQAKKIGVFLANPAVFQVKTTISYAWPKKAVTLSAGGRTGLAVTAFPGPGGGTVTYTAGAAQFGGPAQFALADGPFSAGLIPGAPVTVWINALGAFPATAATIALLAPAHPGPSAAPGAAVGFSASTPGAPGAPPGQGTRFLINVTPGGSIAASIAVGTMTGLMNTATSTAGYPWTTGMVVIAQPAANNAPETFSHTGMESRTAGGSGTINLVAGGLSTRNLSGPNANRGWISLTLVPEPAAILGAVGAFGMLGLCHTLVRRRSSR